MRNLVLSAREVNSGVPRIHGHSRALTGVDKRDGPRDGVLRSGNAGARATCWGDKRRPGVRLGSREGGHGGLVAFMLGPCRQVVLQGVQVGWQEADLAECVRKPERNCERDDMKTTSPDCGVIDSGDEVLGKVCPTSDPVAPPIRVLVDCEAGEGIHSQGGQVRAAGKYMVSCRRSRGSAGGVAGQVVNGIDREEDNEARLQ